MVRMMKYNIRNRLGILSLILVFLLILSVFLTPKSFSSIIYPYHTDEIRHCTVFTLDQKQLELQSENLNTIIYLLENTKYYFRNLYQSKLTGDILHLIISADTDYTQSSFTLYISSEGYAYVMGRKYIIEDKTLYAKLLDMYTRTGVPPLGALLHFHPGQPDQ